MIHSDVFQSICLQFIYALCCTCLCTTIFLTIKMTGYGEKKKKSKIGTDAAKLHVNITSN